jgi:hypothetical protein
MAIFLCLAELMAMNVKHVACTKNTLRIVAFHTGKNFPRLMKDLRGNGTLNMRPMTVSV